MMTREQARDFRAQIEQAASYVPKDKALDMPTVFPTWESVLAAGKQLAAKTIIRKAGTLYEVQQAVTPAAHQPPDAEGMLAIYRPIVPTSEGSINDPIPWVYGMDCTTGKYYSHNGRTYLCKGDMKPCVWEPGSPGLWQWEEIKNG